MVSLQAGPPHLVPANLLSCSKPCPTPGGPQADPSMPSHSWLPAPAPLCISAPATGDQLHAVAPLHCRILPSLGGFLQSMLKSHCQLTVLSPPYCIIMTASQFSILVQSLGVRTLTKVKIYYLFDREVSRRLLPRVDAQCTGEDHTGSLTL